MRASSMETSLLHKVSLRSHLSTQPQSLSLTMHYPISTGVVESAPAYAGVVKDRMEVSGARWGINGAEAILRLRSVAKSQDWDAYWDFYTAQFRDKDFLLPDDNSLILQEKMAA